MKLWYAKSILTALENIEHMRNDGLEFTADPYDMLQEHDLHIQRLIKAHNEVSAWVEQMAKHQEMATQQLSTIEKRLRALEKLVETIARTL